jgi:hypothetical protein
MLQKLCLLSCFYRVANILSLIGSGCGLVLNKISRAMLDFHLNYLLHRLFNIFFLDLIVNWA